MCDWQRDPVRQPFSDLQDEDQLDYGDVVPGVTCTQCRGELVHTSNGAFCDWCASYVPIVGSAIIVKEDEDDDDWETYEEDVTDSHG